MKDGEDLVIFIKKEIKGRLSFDSVNLLTLFHVVVQVTDLLIRKVKVFLLYYFAK